MPEVKYAPCGQDMAKWDALSSEIGPNTHDNGMRPNVTASGAVGVSGDLPKSASVVRSEGDTRALSNDSDITLQRSANSRDVATENAHLWSTAR